MIVKEPPSRRLSAERMYALFLGGDPAYDGRFFTGVLTTGIYCLPSCKARKPKRENVRFFPNVQEARSAGLRACKKCHPDDFARGADPVLESMEALVAEMRLQPGEFPGTATVVRRSGFGATRLFELFRLHYHATPADVLLRARLAAARRQLLDSEMGLTAVAAATGFESLSTFHENFRRLTGLTPALFRALRGSRRFTVALPANYPLSYLRRALGRDPQSVSERLEGDVYTAAIHLTKGPAILRLSLAPDVVEAEISQGDAAEAHAIAIALLGLEQDTGDFVRLAGRLGLARLAAGREGMRVSQTHSVFDGLLWAIVGQQVNVSFAAVMRRRLTERCGEPVGDNLIAPPTPAAVASLNRADLQALQFSRQKADYALALARQVVEGTLDLEALRAGSATRAERVLLALHGFGPWSVNYVMMRSLGLGDCVPLGDTGVSSGLQALLALEERPDSDAVRRLMRVFSPHRSLATAHLWQFNKPVPE